MKFGDIILLLELLKSDTNNIKHQICFKLLKSWNIETLYNGILKNRNSGKLRSWNIDILEQ